MTKLEVMQVANRGYPDGALSEYYNDNGDFVKNGVGSGDALAEYVVSELDCVFEPTDPPARQLAEALRAMRRSARDLQDVINALEQEARRYGTT